MHIITVKLGRSKIRIKDCKGLSSFRGLMFDSMTKYSGALIYANSIWMPFVKHGLDLLFLSADLKIVDVQRAVPVTLNPKTWKVYKCGRAEYCLEIKAGLTKARKGTKILFL